MSDPIHPEGIWQCVRCGQTYVEYINGCVKCEDRGVEGHVRLVVPDDGR